MDSFSVGEVAVLVRNFNPELDKYLGQEVVVILVGSCGHQACTSGYRVRPLDGYEFCAKAADLRKRKPPRDDLEHPNTKLEWNDPRCVWKPAFVPLLAERYGRG